MRVRTLPVIVAFLSLALSCRLGVCQAPATFTGIDLAIVIDQSGSMWGSRFHPAKNDPNAHRVAGARAVLQRLLEHVEGERFIHRVSVIEFADQVDIVASGVEIRDDASDPTFIQRLQTRLSATITDKRLGERFTQTGDALEAAVAEIRKVRALPPATGRVGLILLITDGRPEPNHPAQFTRLRRIAERLRQDNMDLWVVGLNDADNYWNEGDGGVWQEIAGHPSRARLADSAAISLPSVFHSVVDEWLNLSSRLISDAYDCPPYLRRVVFHVSFSQPSAAQMNGFEIVDPSGSSIPRSSGGPTSANNSWVRFTVDDPKPGRYQVQKDLSVRAVVRAEEYSTLVSRLEPMKQADKGIVNRIVFQTKYSAGQSLQVEPQFPIAAFVDVFDPAGKLQSLPAQFTGDGKFEAGGWIPAAAGHYRLRLRAHSPRIGQGRDDLFSHNARSYDEGVDVTNLSPYYLSLATPDPTRTVATLPWRKSIRVEFALVDGNGNPVSNAGKLVRDPQRWLQLNLLFPNSLQAIKTVDMSFDTATGRYSAEVPFSLDLAWLRGLMQPSAIFLGVQEREPAFDPNGYLKGIRLPKKVEAKRVAGNPMTVGPLDVRVAWWFLLLLLVLVLGPLAWVVGRVLTVGLRRWLILRQDRERGWSPVLKVYDELEDPGADAAQAFKLRGVDSLKLDQQVWVAENDQKKSAARFRVKRLLNSAKPRVRIQYRWQGEKNEWTQELSANRVTPVKGLTDQRYKILLQDK